MKIVPKRGRPNTQKELSNEQSEWLTEILDRQDISRKTPGRKDHVYVGKDFNGDRKYVQKNELMENQRYPEYRKRDVISFATRTLVRIVKLLVSE